MVSYSVKLKCNNARIQKDGKASLYLLVIINREIKHLALNLAWPAHLVDNKSGTMLPRTKRDSDFNDYQLIISNELQKVNEVFKVYRIQDRVLNMSLFLQEYQNIDRRRNFITYFSDKIEERFKEKNIVERTKLNHTGTCSLLKRYKSVAPFYAIDKRFLEGFARYLKSKHQNEDSTIWGRIKDVTTYLELARLDGIALNVDYEAYKNTSPSSSLVYLEDHEIDALAKLFNSNVLDPARQLVLRAFLFSCFTSMRISDVQRAEWGWYKMNGELEFLPWKNRRFKKLVNIPLSEIARSLISKRTGKFFDLPTDQEINRTLKDIARSCKITKNLTFHVSRHTFGTHYYRQTKDVVSLQKIMGHSKIETTMIYVHINEQDKKTGMELLTQSFLKGSPFMRMVS